MLIAKTRVYLVKEKAQRYDTDINITCPKSLFDFCVDYHDMQDLPQENFVIIALTTKNRIISSVMTVGTCDGSLVSTRDIFQWLLLSNASHFAIAHNHPSGISTPSNEDIRVTERIKEASKIMGIELIDHVIIGDRYYSLKENGLASL